MRTFLIISLIYSFFGIWFSTAILSQGGDCVKWEIFFRGGCVNILLSVVCVHSGSYEISQYFTVRI